MDASSASPEPFSAVRFSPVVVLSAGALTSLATIAIVFLLNAAAPEADLPRILFVGPIAVGLLAGSGYGLSAWWSGVRIEWRTLGAILLLQILYYLVLQYLDFWSLSGTLPPGTTFWQHYDNMTRAIALEVRGQAGAPLGEWGYVVRALEILGFALGGLIPPAIMRQRPHCDICQCYMPTESLWWLPASVTACDYESTELAAWNEYLEEQAAAETRATALISQLQEAVADNDSKKAST